MAFDANSHSLIAGWEKNRPDLVRREIVRFNHRLAENGLFEDEALARLLDSHPRDQLTICTMRPNPPAHERWIAGEAPDLDGGEILEAVKRGHLWISPRRVMTVNPIYAGLFRRLMDEFSLATGIRVVTSDGALLLSSPNMGIFFHVDAAEAMLWHVRGHKTIYIYPPREDFVTEAALEAILLKENLSDLPYRADMEDHVNTVSLAPGEAVAWPMHSPHRVVNGPDFNVSVSIEYSTPESILNNNVFYLNGRLRRMTGAKLNSRTTLDVLKPGYLLAAKALKTVAPLRSTVESNHKRRFTVDLDAHNCISWHTDKPDWA